MRRFKNYELKELYYECKDAKEGAICHDNFLLLEVYNQEFECNLDYLHYHMALELMKKLEKEIVRRFIESV